MRLVDNNYQPLSLDYTFSEGEEVLVSEDSFCSYSTGVVVKENNQLYIDHYMGKLKLILGFNQNVNGKTWILTR